MDDWYKDAIIYEVHVRAFQDSNGDGIGDLRGLTARLDYIKDLGVDTVWLLPFYPSPLRDDGYDIADYTTVHPDYGTLDDFVHFLEAAHARRLRVITELVVNHTSDQHAWFRRARRAAPGSPERDFYVWSDTPDRYEDVRIIFSDTETSNWAWDPVAKAYYWHRFFSHQPDLNYDNPAVQAAVLEVLDFWLGLGVDGLRLDAIPYLYERDGTNGENLPETHAFLKTLRRHVDEHHPGRMLLAEANQWPEDAVEYFGDGDECHMSFHFPLMPRLYMSVEMETRLPVIDILDQTPALPEGAQWALFLRNHDELTLEMVTEEERDFMYRVYAGDRRARINLGIRRRLAPLLANDRRRIELLHGLLLSLPGTPVLYYGDELGMGDNIWLGDRDGVRTPMQWSNGRNAGFSDANPQRLYLPVVVDPQYHYETINVETQHGSPNSLLWWVRHILSLRRRHPVFGRGAIEFLDPANPRVLAYLRRDGLETVLVVANLSRHSQYVELDLAEFAGRTPIELFGRTEFPRIGELTYLLTLGPHAFYWFGLEARPADVEWPVEGELLEVTGPVENLFVANPQVERALVAHLPGRPWFVDRGRRLDSVRIRDVLPICHEDHPVPAYLVMVEATFGSGAPAMYVLPLAFPFGDEAARFADVAPERVVCRLRRDHEIGLLVDATADSGFRRELLATIADQRPVEGGQGALHMLLGTTPVQPLVESADPLDSSEGNTTIAYGEDYVLKMLRRTEPGIDPDLEIRRHLTEHSTFEAVTDVLGSVEYQTGSESRVVGILQRYVTHEGDAFDRFRASVSDLLDGFAGRRRPSLPAGHLLDLAERPLPKALGALGTDHALMRTLGHRVGELHSALGAATELPDFKPEPMGALVQRGLYQSLRGQVRQTIGECRRALDADGSQRAALEAVVDAEAEILGLLSPIRDGAIGGMRIRLHGDLRLDEVLVSGDTFVFYDLAGDTTRPVSERRIKASPLRDVAEMVRSIHYVAMSTLVERLAGEESDADRLPLLERAARVWYRSMAGSFLGGYLEAAGGSGLLPPSDSGRRTLLDGYLVDRAMRELLWELRHRPDWLPVAVAGVREALDVEPLLMLG